VVLPGGGKDNVIVDDLKKKLAEDYHQFDVLQLIDIIHELFSGEDIFFETDSSLAFPPSDVSSLNIRHPQQISISLPMMNLLGITTPTPLPIGLADYANRDRKGSAALQSFLSIMQNRIHHLLVEAMRKYNIWRDAGSPAMRLFEKLTARSLEQFEGYDLFWLSAFSNKTRSADTLKRIIQSIWKDIPVSIEENVGRWTTVENRRPLGRDLHLGRSAIVIGSKIFDRTAKFRISLGPVDINTYKSLLPGLSNNCLLKNILSRYINKSLICELEVLCYQRDLDLATLEESSSLPQEVGGLGRTMRLGRSEDDAVHSYRTVIWG
jgi:type VI secretion system protein ImpH